MSRVLWRAAGIGLVVAAAAVTYVVLGRNEQPPRVKVLVTLAGALAALVAFALRYWPEASGRDDFWDADGDQGRSHHPGDGHDHGGGGGDD
jgi:hypothetical protein